MLFYTAIILLPLWMLFVTSFSSDSVAAQQGFVLVPQGFYLDSYIKIWGSMYMRAFYNSVFVTVVGTATSLAFTCTMAYALAQPTLVFRRTIMNMVLLVIIVDIGIIPYFLLIRSLGMLNSYTAIIIPAAIGSFNLILMRNFFQSIPDSLVESGRLDGASELTILVRIVLPISLPIVAAITLFSAVSHWNRFFEFIIYITDTSKHTLQVLLRQLVFEDTSDMGATTQYNNFKMAVMIFAMMPMLILYPFIQKHFISGIMLGSVKA